MTGGIRLFNSKGSLFYFRLSVISFWLSTSNRLFLIIFFQRMIKTCLLEIHLHAFAVPFVKKKKKNKLFVDSYFFIQNTVNKAQELFPKLGKTMLVYTNCTIHMNWEGIFQFFFTVCMYNSTCSVYV